VCSTCSVWFLKQITFISLCHRDTVADLRVLMAVRETVAVRCRGNRNRSHMTEP